VARARAAGRHSAAERLDPNSKRPWLNTNRGTYWSCNCLEVLVKRFLKVLSAELLGWCIRPQSQDAISEAHLEKAVRLSLVQQRAHEFRD